MATLATRGEQAPRFALDRVRPEAVVIGAIGITIALQVYLAFAKSINWDEFHHFSQIHRHLRGEDVRWVQTPFVWLFWWVPSLPGDGLFHIRLIRVLTIPFELVTLVAIFGIAQRFTSRNAALLCTLAYATGGWVFLHAFALRADMIAAALLAAALWLVTCRPLRPYTVAAAGLLFMLAMVATLKSALWAPAFVGAALLRTPSGSVRRMVPGVAIAAVALVAALAAVIVLAPQLAQDIESVATRSAPTMFSAGLFPRGHYLLIQMGFAPLLTLLVALAAGGLWRLPMPRREKLALACFLAPLLSVVLYRNAFPYYYAFILPPVLAACGPAAERLIERYRVAPVALLLLAIAVVLTAMQDRSVTRAQQQVVDGVNAIFERPVVYIDESGMIPGYPRAVNHFATGWALEMYRNSGRPEYSRVMLARPVPMLLRNTHTLRNPFEDTGIDENLLPADVAALKANYIPHWGEVYVAGKRIPAGPSPRSIDIAVPGIYTVEGSAVVVEGKSYRPGDLVSLPRGAVSIGGGRSAETVLRWGDHLPRPNFPAPDGPLFTNY